MSQKKSKEINYIKKRGNMSCNAPKTKPKGLTKTPAPPPPPPKKEDVLKRIIAKWLIRIS